MNPSVPINEGHSKRWNQGRPDTANEDVDYQDYENDGQPSVNCTSETAARIDNERSLNMSSWHRQAVAVENPEALS